MFGPVVTYLLIVKLGLTHKIFLGDATPKGSGFNENSKGVLWVMGLSKLCTRTKQGTVEG